MPDSMPPLRGDETELFKLHDQAVRRIVASSVTADRVMLDDACAFAWLKLLTTQPERLRIRPWLVRVAVRYVWAATAAARRAAPLVDAEGPDFDELVAQRETARAALQALAALRHAERDALALVVGGFTHAEIAELIDGSPRLVRGRVSAAREKIARTDRRS